MAGPTKGGTEIEIIGRELGKQFEDIRNTVQVAGFQCKPDPAKYEVSLRWEEVITNSSWNVFCVPQYT